jgi:hypothetical protein
MSDPITNSQPAGPAAPAARKRSSSRKTEIIAVLILIIIVVCAAMFEEPIGAFFRLRLYDQGAPARTVEAFMTAVQKRDQKSAEAAVDAPELKPLTDNGKWDGFFMVTQAGRMDYLPEDLAPTQGEPKASDPKFIPEGDAAEVNTTVGTGKALKYRLKMRGGSWKIVEILGGRIHHK